VAETETAPQQAPQPAAQVHPHPIRWDIDQQLWVCSIGCGFTRPKREGEVVPTRDEARQEAARAGTGADFADLRTRRDAGPDTGAAGRPAPAATAEA
jgi:hypothetical protein